MRTKELRQKANHTHFKETCSQISQNGLSLAINTLFFVIFICSLLLL